MATGISVKKWKGTETLSTSACDGIELVYKGKKTVAEILSTKPANLRLRQTISGSTGENKLFHGDNAATLAALLNDASIAGKVDLIYIDPPYATQSVFHSRSEKAAYTDLLKGSHYLEFLRERIILGRELLSNSGSFYLHLDDAMAFHAKLICDEIFGEKNFRNFIIRKKCNTKNYTRRQYGNIVDYVLFYTKGDDYIWNRPVKAWEDDAAIREYSHIDENGRRFKKVPIHAPGERNGATGKEWRGMLPPKGKHWQYLPEKLDELDAKGEIFWSKNGNPRRKIFLDKNIGIPIQDVWMDFKDAHNQNIKITGYPTEKNFDMLKLIVEASSNKNSLVLDFFSGSGTTLEAAQYLNRNWIGVDSSEEAIATSIKRLTVGREPMGDFVGNKNTQIEMNVDCYNGGPFQVWDTY